MKRYPDCYFVLVLGFLTACTSPPPPRAPVDQLNVVTLDHKKLVTGQTVYVPIYSHIYAWEQSLKLDLTATLSLRNTDLTQPIIITSANYYDSSGKLVRKYIEKPIELGSLAATAFVVNQDDDSGGSGAAFIVEWVAQRDVSDPVIEAVMINASGNQGLSFVSPGRVIKRWGSSR
ncbi:hypothetical protein DO97_02895 [Neosynechococcus sphagnicola sy1]|uniref:DUF3124 domain-containing protein n=1 Tax=Neosynechococcus sphagnicola sy1 TaxID=1497020 RepID=A0A098TL40_9CYAN|nr:DUF3124 domain-containing protein [Neosynechococcus sphagnicola]KGF73009.1 hypothetical protein DO97_02895 [Neosynechococcus sphagnicola sy1]